MKASSSIKSLRKKTDIRSINKRACQGIHRNDRKAGGRRIYVRSIRSCECLCSEFSLAQQKRTKEGLGPVLAGQRGSAHRTDMKMSGFIRQHRGTRDEDEDEDGNSTAHGERRR